MKELPIHSIRLLLLAVLLSTTIVTAQGQTEEPKSKKELRKERRLNRKANTQKYLSPILIYPALWGIQDTRATPGVYRNIGVGGAINRKVLRPEYELYQTTQFNAGFGIPNYEDGDILYNTLISHQTSYLKPFKGNIELGGHVYALQHTRIIPVLNNSGVNSDIAVGIGPSASYSLQATFLKKETDFTFHVGVPIFNYVNRIPKYGLSFNGSSSFFAPIGRFNRWVFQINAERPYKKSLENRINWFYRWEYYGMEEFEGLHQLRVAQHQIGFHLWINRN